MTGHITGRARRLPALAALLLLSGCAVGPDFTPPKLFTPASWFGKSHPAPSAGIAEAPPDAAWWGVFNDPVLTGLEERLAANNLDVRMAALRLGEARAQASIVSAGRLPSVNGSGSYTRSKVSDEGVVGLFGGGGGSKGSFASTAGVANGTSGREGAFPASAAGISIPPFDLFQYGFDARWEADIWGRVRRQSESAAASRDASEEQLRGVLVTAQAELARNYIAMRGAEAQLGIAKRNLASAHQSLTLTQARYKGGLTTELDVANASAQEANTAAAIPSLALQRDELLNAISLLLGLAPQALAEELSRGAAIPPTPPSVPVGLPSELARRRPDIRAAEARLHAATADVGVAIGDFYPRISLDGSFGFQALQFKNMWDWNAHQYGIGPSISVPIFQGGRLRATLELRRAEQAEAAIAYQQTVLGAWHEVDNSLRAYAADQERNHALARAVRDAERAHGLAQQRYREGVADFLSVLDAQRQVLAAELSMADGQTRVATDLVMLYKALGGGWERDLPAAPAAASAGAAKH